MARWETLPENLKVRANMQKIFAAAEKAGIEDFQTISTPKRSKTAKGETANRITANVLRIINMTPGCVAYRVNNVGVWDAAKGSHRGGNTEKGLPDIWACCRGRFLVIEVKAGKDKLSEHQEKRGFEIQRAKGFFMVANSTDQFQTEWERLEL